MQPQFDPQCARLWISRYGAQARDEALKRARAFEESGANGTAWRRVAEAIGCLAEVPPGS